MRKLARNVSVAAVVCLALLATPVMADDAVDRPNILFIAVDDLKPLTGSYGVTTVKTPSIDELAERSTVFTRAYTAYPVCGPSRASLLTGLRPENSGITDLKTRMRDIHPNILTLPQFFRNHGYQTAASGKIFDPRNVDSRQADDPASWSIPYQAPRGKVDSKVEPNYAVRAFDAPASDLVDGDINRRGIELLDTMVKTDRPFFLAVGYKKPHLPFDAPKPFFDLYDRDAFELEPFQDAPAGSDASFVLNDNNELLRYVPSNAPDGSARQFGERHNPDDVQRELLHGYHASVSFIDSLVGELLQALDATGKADNTIVVLWGDHGFHLGDHGLWGKHTTMEQASRVPMMIHVPGGTPGKAATLVELLDLFPTLAALAGLEAPGNLQGVDLAPVLADPGHDLGKVAISQYKRQGAYGYSMRTDRYRYTEWVMPDGTVAYRDLYDLQQDPGETRNIGGSPDHAKLMDELARELRENGAGLKRLKVGP